MTVVAPPQPAPRSAERAGSLPPPVRRWLREARPELHARPSAIYLEGPARFKRGRLPYLPLFIRTWNRLGYDRVSELEVSLLGVTVLRGLDAYVDGHGFTRIGSQLSTGPEIDQGAFHVLLLETLLVPSAWPPDIRWEPIDDDTAAVVAPFAGGTERGVMRFDPVTGLPAAYSTDRYKLPGGPKVPWAANLASWRSFGPVEYPSRLSIQWGDDRQPWLRMQISRVRIEPSMTEALATARAVLAGA
ncbi:MAG TPA: DUF6544 family protein [Candidatus Limnocylindria bacterium]|jgi:hypothetical protein